MHILSEVQDYLKEVLSASRVKECYDLISYPELRINTDDKLLVACQEDHELAAVTTAIYQILVDNNLTTDQDAIESSVSEICTYFTSQDVHDKHRIPFYILVLDELI